jgi:hypothetical protein
VPPGRGGGRQRQQYPETGRATTDPLHPTVADAAEDLWCCHDFLSFVSACQCLAGQIE